MALALNNLQRVDMPLNKEPKELKPSVSLSLSHFSLAQSLALCLFLPHSFSLPPLIHFLFLHVYLFHSHSPPHSLSLSLSLSCYVYIYIYIYIYNCVYKSLLKTTRLMDQRLQTGSFFKNFCGHLIHMRKFQLFLEVFLCWLQMWRYLCCMCTDSEKGR